MTIAIGADHAGFELKEKLKLHLTANGIEVDDRGTRSLESVDYPDFARAVGEEVAARQADFGLLVCGSGDRRPASRGVTPDDGENVARAGLAFASRFGLFTAYFTVSDYLFYAVQDYVPGFDTDRLPRNGSRTPASTVDRHRGYPAQHQPRG